MAEWSAVVAAASFVVLTIALLAALRDFRRRIVRFEQAVRSIEAEAVPFMRELRELAAEASQVARRAGRSVERLDRLLEAAQRWEDAVRRSASTACRIADAVDSAAAAHVERAIRSGRARIAETLDWAELGWSVWKWWQSKRAEASDSSRATDEMRDPE
jgi:uncharacterized protein YoxC